MQENATARILVVDSSANVRSALEACVNAHAEDGLAMAGCAKDGLEALEMLQKTQPDVLITDLVLQSLDGFELMESMDGLGLQKRPEVLVLSALNCDETIARSMSLGARYYMVKPFDGELVIKRVKDMLNMHKPAERKPAAIVPVSKCIDEKIASMFLTIGIPAHIKGYQFLREVVKLVVATPDMINRITKELYPTIAKRFDTTASKVERAIRHAIEVAWNRGRIEQVNQIFGHCVYTPNDKPTNGEFIALIADKLSYDHSA